MEKLKVLVTDYVFESFEIEEEILKEVGAELVVMQCASADELRAAVMREQPDAILNTYLPGLNKSVLEVAEHLRVVVRYGIGLDTINVPDATELGVMVANVPDYCIDEVADHALALFLCVTRKVALSDAKVKGGEWSLSYVKPLKALRDMQVGIVGFGRIGRAIAMRLVCFGVKQVVFYDPMLAENAEGCKAVGLDELIADSDAIFLQCPATNENKHLLNAERFGQMKRQPVIVNTARGTLIDTDALLEALASGKVMGAGLDVLDDESVVEGDKLKGVDNLVVTPHSAWLSGRAIKNLRVKAATTVLRVLKGEIPEYLANPEVLRKD